MLSMLTRAEHAATQCTSKQPPLMTSMLAHWLTRGQQPVAAMLVLNSHRAVGQRCCKAIRAAAAAVRGGCDCGIIGAQLGAVAAQSIDGAGGRVGVGIHEGAKSAQIHVLLKRKDVQADLEVWVALMQQAAEARSLPHACTAH